MSRKQFGTTNAKDAKTLLGLDNSNLSDVFKFCDDHLAPGFSNYGSRPQTGSPKIILGSRNKLPFCALCRKTLKIPVVPRSFWKKL